ncbi:hypothetical protein B0H13DRAFT_1907156 [Mycena leptocephala]|nr:hypothetical protein B0H13DRAFT_1907156 [Mycena leptocephala]
MLSYFLRMPNPKFIEKDPEIRASPLEKTRPWNLRPYIKKPSSSASTGSPPFLARLAVGRAIGVPDTGDPTSLAEMFYDHVVKWCIAALGAAEIDFRFSVLWPHTGMRHFKEGISKSKQATGREHRDIMRYILPVIAGASRRDS